MIMDTESTMDTVSMDTESTMDTESSEVEMPFNPTRWMQQEMGTVHFVY